MKFMKISILQKVKINRYILMQQIVIAIKQKVIVNRFAVAIQIAQTKMIFKIYVLIKKSKQKLVYSFAIRINLKITSSCIL